MKRNVGGADRAIRIVVGMALLAMGLLHVITGALAIAAFVFGAIALLTGLVRYCPAWSLFGINTISAEHR
ncbi:MAG TPA: DUF2892 domain-containing protein [Candidatus Dormibacteraeota bacterium]|nr:DUF2892 domain-containing protein [Candidatus Dormibacteraeota bacterium]